MLSSIQDKISKQKIQQAWVIQQLKEVEADPLEEQVLGAVLSVLETCSKLMQYGSQIK